MNRENRYYVFKCKDVYKYLSVTEQTILGTLLGEVYLRRQKDGKKDLDCVVVEHDWPEYEIVWKMIEDRVDGVEEEHPREQVSILNAKDKLVVDGKEYVIKDDIVELEWSANVPLDEAEKIFEEARMQGIILGAVVVLPEKLKCQ